MIVGTDNGKGTYYGRRELLQKCRNISIPTNESSQTNTQKREG